MEIAASLIGHWLREPMPVEAMCARLTRLGYEVVETRPLDAGLEPVRLVQVVDRRPHPSRSRLAIVTAIGGTEPVEVVTGAANGLPGERLFYAPPGTRLPDGRTLGTREFGGVPSPGMLCSAGELGLRAGPGDLWVWKGTGEPGDRYTDLMGAETILVIEMTPNLAQFAQSARGLARDLAAEAGGRLPCLPALQTPTVPGRVVLRAPDRCPAYALYEMALPDTDLPIRLQRQLRASGFRLVNPMVDWTNYILVDTGQPLHAFDAERVRLPIVVRMAADGESFVTLDGQTLTLQADDLVIADQNGPLALAGVMGGRDSAIDEGTRRVLVESAHFTAPGIYRTARRYNLRTDAAERFLRGTDPEALLPVLGHLLTLLGEDGRPPTGVLAFAGEAPERRRAAYRRDQIRNLMSASWTDAEMDGVLERLGFVVAEDEAVVPSFRPDVSETVDLAEELGRILSLDGIPDRVPPVTTPAVRDAAHRFRERVRDLVAAAGYTEILSRVFVDAGGVPGPDRPPVVHRLVNPLREEEAALRTELWPSLLETLAFNRDRGVDLAPLFEVGVVYRGTPDAPVEEWELAAVLPFLEDLNLHLHLHRRGTPDVYALTGLVDLLAERLHWDLRRVSGDPVAFLHPGRQQKVLDGGLLLGRVGEIHPDVLQGYRLPPAGLVSLVIRPPAARPAPSVIRPSRYPPLTRDLSVVWPDGLLFEEARRAIEEAGSSMLESCVPYDRFSGSFGQSLTIRLRFRAPERTLTEDEGDRLVQAILVALKRHGVVLRE
ncbi:MAG: phenylalanine--tRNA ligase subunit beta [Firmicutes bacterium]|nr:phenylalanine--tRNA ligase subunit beta [Bacillota bacterium]